MAQDIITPSIKNMQGIWSFKDENYESYMIVIDNRMMRISSFKDGNSANTYGKPFSYFGFWNQSIHKNEKPKMLNELEKEGSSILFYDFSGPNYDTNGILVKPSRACWMTLNEDSDDTIPNALRFYFKGTPDVYIKTDSIPKHILNLLRKNKSDWKIYNDFLKIKNRRIINSKAIIYSKPDSKTNMYLIKNDEVEILEEKNSWVKFKYYGKKAIIGWLKKSDMD